MFLFIWDEIIFFKRSERDYDVFGCKKGFVLGNSFVLVFWLKYVGLRKIFYGCLMYVL